MNSLSGASFVAFTDAVSICGLPGMCHMRCQFQPWGSSSMKLCAFSGHGSDCLPSFTQLLASSGTELPSDNSVHLTIDFIVSAVPEVANVGSVSLEFSSDPYFLDVGKGPRSGNTRVEVPCFIELWRMRREGTSVDEHHYRSWLRCGVDCCGLLPCSLPFAVICGWLLCWKGAAVSCDYGGR